MRYWADITGVQLDDATKTTWAQLLPIKKFTHKLFGTINITPERVQRFADSVNNKVRGIDLDVDYDHKVRDGKAAGWIKAAEARTDGLWVQISFTDRAYAAVKAGEYKYLSADYVDNWEHPETNQKFVDVLQGAALTNRPYVKSILPINLSELEEPVDPEKEMNKALGLPEDATPAQRLEALNKRIAEPEDKKEPEAEVRPEEKVPVLALSEDDLKALGTAAPLVKQLSDLVTAQAATLDEQTKRLEALETTGRSGQVAFKLSELTKGTGSTVAPATIEKVTNAIAGLPVQLGDQVVEAFGELIKQGIGTVQLGETATVRNEERRETEPTKKFNEAVAKVMADNKELSYGDAVETVVLAEPDLYENYRQSVLKAGE